MKHSDISHLGRIIEITPEFTTVEIISSSACSSCHAKGLCGVSEEQVKLISVPTDPYEEYHPGDEVNVFLRKTMGLKAVWISYVIPLLVLMILILSLSPVIRHEAYVGLAALGGVGLYYVVIYLLRDCLAKDFVFYIRKNRIKY